MPQPTFAANDASSSPSHLASEDEAAAAAAPDRSPSQRMAALQLANEVRSERARIKRDMKAGRRQFQSLLLDPPPSVETAKVVDLMLSMPRYGRVKVSKVLHQCRISPSKTVAGLSERQRHELIAALNRR